MNAIVLAAGYATRLRPLTDSVPKHLLPVGGRPLLDHLCDRIDEVDQVNALHVVTNARFSSAFERWGAARSGRLRPLVHDDGTQTNDDRLGAIGDVAFVLDRAGLEGDDALVLAGDNLFDFDLREMVAFTRGKGTASCVAVYDCSDRELAKQYGVVALDDDDRVVAFVEKPADPPSTLAATAAYVYHEQHVPLVRRYLAEGNAPDQPGNFLAWLYSREPVYGFRFTGEWFDIGTPEQLLVADNRLRGRAGLPEREAYALQPSQS